MGERIGNDGNHLDLASAADTDQQAMRQKVFRQDGFPEPQVDRGGNNSVRDHFSKRTKVYAGFAQRDYDDFDKVNNWSLGVKHTF